jgi:NADPH2:quinone reductase
VRSRTVLVAGAAGAVGNIATTLASWGGATVLATVRSPGDIDGARRAGATHVFVLDGSDVAAAIRRIAPGGVDRVVEVALGPNASLDAAVLAQGGVLAAYSSPEPEPRIPFWPLLFNNIAIRLLGSDDFAAADKRRAAADLVTCLTERRLTIDVAHRFSVDEIAAAHEAVERPTRPGRVVVVVDRG